jgi:transposase-like protein
VLATLVNMSTTSFDIECPHCHKTFTAETIEGAAARYRGFKCTHCRLFVPYERAAEQDLLERTSPDESS